MFTGIIDAGFQELQTCKSEEEVQNAWFKLLTALQQELLPYTCFHVHDTSKQGYLNAPVAKIDFTCTANGQVSNLSCVHALSQSVGAAATPHPEQLLALCRPLVCYPHGLLSSCSC